MAYSLRGLQRVGASLRFLSSCLDQSSANQFASSNSAIKFGNNLLTAIFICELSLRAYPLMTRAVKTEVATLCRPTAYGANPIFPAYVLGRDLAESRLSQKVAVLRVAQERGTQ